MQPIGKPGSRRRRRSPRPGPPPARSAVVFAAAAALWLGAVPGAAGKPLPPAKRTYFVVFLGMEGGYDSGADCLRFKRRTVCSRGQGVCGTWARAGQQGEEEHGLSFELSFEEAGAEMEIAGRARIDDRREGSSLGGAAAVLADGRAGNFAMTGRETGRRNCRALADEFNARGATRPGPGPATGGR